MFYGGVLHFYLESVAYELYLIKVNRFQYLAPVTHKTGCSVLYFYTGDKTHINRSKLAHQNPAHRPVNHVYAFNVARADYSICIITGLPQF